MAVFSIVNFTKLDRKTYRLDAQYFRRDYLEIEALLNKRGAIPLYECVSKIIHPAEIKRRYVDIGIWFIRAQNVRPLSLNFENPVFISEEDSLSLPNNKVIKGDILLTRTGANFGQCTVYLEDKEAIASSHTFIIRTSKVDACFLAVYFNTNYGRQLLDKGMYGAAQPELAPYFIEQILIPNLSLKFQKSISSVVFKSHIQLQSSNDFYSQAERLLLSELGLQDWRPARALTYVRNYSQVAKAGRMDAEYFHPKYQELFSIIPSHIRFDRLGRLTTYTKGVEVGSEAYTDSGIPFWRVSNLTKHGLDDSNANFISQDLYNTLRQNYEPQQGEILLSKDATPGLAYYLEHPIQGIVSSGILRLAIIDTIPPYYLELVLNSVLVQMQIEQDAGGSIIKHWKPSEVCKTLIPRLSDDKEKEIAGLIQQSHAARREAKALLEKAKRAVEIAIEESEDKAMEFIKG